MDGDVRRQIIEEDLPILTLGIGFGAFQSMSQFGEGNDRYDHFRSSMYSEKLSEKLPEPFVHGARPTPIRWCPGSVPRGGIPRFASRDDCFDIGGEVFIQR